MSAPAAIGFLGSLRQLGESLLCAMQTRVELLSTELQEEKQRIFKSLVLIGVAIFCGAAMFTFASVAVVYALPGRERLPALIVLALIYAAAFAVACAILRRHLRAERPFEDTLHELTTDRRCFQPPR